MNQQLLIRAVNRLLAKWLKDRRSVSVIDGFSDPWRKGVIYGITITREVIKDHLDETMKKLLPLVLLVLLTGCEKVFKGASIPGINLKAPKHLTVLIGGQSIAVGLTQYGLGDLQRTSNTVLDVIPCAVGSTSVTQWQQGQQIYNDCLALVKGRHVDAVLWEQGEYEAETIGAGNDWDVYFLNTVNGLRADLHQADLPVLFGRLGDGARYGLSWYNVRDAQDRVNAPGVYKVNLDNIPGEAVDRSPHYTVEGYTLVGSRFGSYLGGIFE